jgi:vitellogenic carboxypeptidase-like protein
VCPLKIFFLAGDKTYFKDATGYQTYYNILFSESQPAFEYYAKYLNESKTRFALHVGCMRFSPSNGTVFKHLIEDTYKSVKSWFATLIDNYKVLLYSGNLDIIVALPLTDNFLKNLGEFRS